MGPVSNMEHIVIIHYFFMWAIDGSRYLFNLARRHHRCLRVLPVPRAMLPPTHPIYPAKSIIPSQYDWGEVVMSAHTHMIRFSCTRDMTLSARHIWCVGTHNKSYFVGAQAWSIIKGTGRRGLAYAGDV